MKFSVYRYNSQLDNKPFMQNFDLDISKCDGVMLLDALIALKEQDDTLTFRRSCGEGVCGSDGMNINGKNGLACITPLSSLKNDDKVILRPLPGMPVIRDLVVDLSNFYFHYEKIKPYFYNNDNNINHVGETLQSPKDRKKLDGLYECILCACCTSFCMSYWWNPEKFIGPAAALQSARFLSDSRDNNTVERLSILDDSYSIFRCRGIMNCVDVCPKGLSPNGAIGIIRRALLKEGS
ncbi:MAG: succinate dehydrogenase iron-sulfur subunit [Candidatus Azosocius agrarius]|nr:MAG: succinate dehydrogenase iron-sulfur subunit [Gammaproteobacteria bacterium]